MSTRDKRPGDFEQQTRVVLEESVARVSGRIRSRLNAARQMAVAEAVHSRRPAWWQNLMLTPIVGATAAAVLVALVLWTGRPDPTVPNGPGLQGTIEDLDLLAESETLELIEEWDGAFYEWAAAQAETAAEGDADEASG